MPADPLQTEENTTDPLIEHLLVNQDEHARLTQDIAEHQLQAQSSTTEAVSALEPILEHSLQVQSQTLDALTAVPSASIEDGTQITIKGLKGDRGEKGDQGEPGSPGPQGETGLQGIPGLDSIVPGPQGLPGRDGKHGRDGTDGVPGKDGKQGKPGKDGKDGSPDSGPEIVRKIDGLLPFSSLRDAPDLGHLSRIATRDYALSELTDVNLAGLTSNQYLKWSGTQWVPGTPSGGSSIILTTTGVTGPATYNPGTGALNIPQYASNPGTVTSLSIASANGFAGTVANSTSTPAITLTTSITGLLKGNGTAILAASAGTDYQAPLALTTTGTSGAATLVGNTLNIPQYPAASPNYWTRDSTNGYISPSILTDKMGFGTLAPLSLIEIQNNGIAAAPVDTSGLVLRNTTASTVSTQRASPSITFEGQGFATTSSTSMPTRWQIYALPIQSTTTPANSFVIAQSINGGAYTNVLTLSNSGAATILGGVISNGSYQSSPTAAAASFYVTSSTSAAAVTDSRLYPTGSTALTTRVAVGGNSSPALTAGSSYGGLSISRTLVSTAATGTHPLLANLIVNAITTPSAGGAVVTRTASLYIDGATTGTVTDNNYALYSRAGANYFGGSLQVASTLLDSAGSAGTSGQLLSSTGTGTAWTTASGTGSVTSVSVASANGFAGTVATATSTPAITISTTVTGLLKGNSTAISAAVAGTDYLAPGAIGATVQAYSANLTSWAAKAVPAGAVLGTTDAQVVTNKDLTSGTNTFPTFNQSTTGTAANVTGTVAVSNGGTGASTAAGARANLGVVAVNTGTTGQFASSMFALTDSVTVAVDWNNGNRQKVTFAGNRTLTFANPIAGATYTLLFIQDTTGVRVPTLPTIRWRGGTAPTFSIAAGKKDLVTLFYDGTEYLGDVSLNY